MKEKSIVGAIQLMAKAQDGGAHQRTLQSKLIQVSERLTIFGATSEQQRPNSRENRASSGARRRSQALRNATLYGLQNLHPGSNPGGASKILRKITLLVVRERC
jgi:hypothetical protein